MSEDIPITRSTTLESPKKFNVTLHIECDCDFDEGEYAIYLFKIINGPIEKDDFDLIEEAILNDIDRDKLPAVEDEGLIEIVVIESGEWEDVFWHKYYKLESVNFNPEEEKS